MKKFFALAALGMVATAIVMAAPASSNAQCPVPVRTCAPAPPCAVPAVRYCPTPTVYYPPSVRYYYQPYVTHYRPAYVHYNHYRGRRCR